MTKDTYNDFIASIQSMIMNFIEDYNIPAACELQHKKTDDIKWTLHLGDIFGSVNILLESWYSVIDNNGKIDKISIPMLFNTYRDNENLFNLRCGHVDRSNGTFILEDKTFSSTSLKMAFKDVLDTWAYTQTKKPRSKVFATSLN